MKEKQEKLKEIFDSIYFDDQISFDGLDVSEYSPHYASYDGGKRLDENEMDKLLKINETYKENWKQLKEEFMFELLLMAF